jgi:hypothetical protein
MAHAFSQEWYDQVDHSLEQMEDYLDAVAEEIEIAAAPISRRGRSWGGLQALQAREQIMALRHALAEEQSWRAVPPPAANPAPWQQPGR